LYGSTILFIDGIIHLSIEKDGVCFEILSLKSHSYKALHDKLQQGCR